MSGVYLARSFRPDPSSGPGIVEWFGPRKNKSGVENYTQAHALQAIERLERYLKSHGAVMRRTPTGAGMILLEHMLPVGAKYYPLPDGPQDLIRHEMTAACVQHVPQAAPITEIHCYDARAAYVSKTRYVPCHFGDLESIISDTKDEYADYQIGFYECEITVPRGWQHVGLAPRRPRQYRQFWDYPSTPGEAWISWLDGAELQLLRKNMLSPWPVKILKRILFPQGETLKYDPLGPMMRDIMGHIERIGDHPAPVERLIRAGLRAMAIQTIGQLHNTGKEATERVAFGDAVPPTVPRRSWPDVQPDGSTIYHWKKPHTGILARWNQPQMSAHVWAKWRVEVLKKALMIPRDQILGIYTDAIYTSSPTVAFTDGGKVGQFREKDQPTMLGRFSPAPRTMDKLLEMYNDGGR